MADYRQMYSVLFNNVTKAIDLLQEAQRQTEELFISSDMTSIKALPFNLKPMADEGKDGGDSQQSQSPTVTDYRVYFPE